MSNPHHLRVEHLEAPLGLYVRRPRLSWSLPTAASGQLAYQVRAGEWDSGWVDSDQSILIPYSGPDLQSGQRVEWQVRVRTELGESGWSQPSSWEMGLLEPEDWSARWIEPREDGDPPAAGERPAQLLRRDFTVSKPITRARLHATAHGIYEAFLGGRRVGDLELTPGYSAYRDILHVQTYDVTGLVTQGAGTLALVLSDGWFRGRNGAMRIADFYGTRTAALCELRLDHPDGSTTVIGTDELWTSSTAVITAADLMDGERHDLRRVQPGWSAPEFDDAHWSKVSVVTYGLYADFARLTASPAPPVRAIEELPPVSASTLPSGTQIIDLGQNINGRLRLTVPAGDTLTLTHGEALDPGGDLTTDHLRGVDWQSGQPLPIGQIDVVTANAEWDAVFEPRHTTHGFRYVRVEGASRPITAATGVIVHTDLRRTGRFRCSDDRINRLHQIADWAFRGNACDIPTDCPQRERAGWTGDWMLFVPTATLLYDVAGFSVKWLRDLAADQWDNGCLSNFAPDPAGRQVQDLPPEILDHFAGSSAWGDASVIVPWELYRAYGDLDILHEFRPMMVRWLDFAVERARTRRHPDRVARSAEPAAHEKFLWDAGFHWGEWCEPGAEPEAFRTADQGAIATAYLYRSAALLSRISSLTGHDADAGRYAELAGKVLQAWRSEFIAADGSLSPPTQATYVRALAFRLVPDDLRAATVNRLVDLIRAAGTHVGTGFLATPYLLPVLADTGHLDLAYDLLFQDSEPSWLTMIDRGATTVWEEWNGIDEHGTPHGSLNHYSKGAVIRFLHTHTAGIRQAPDDELSAGPDTAAYRRFLIEPRPGGGITHAEASLDTPYGAIAVSWRIVGEAFELTATVPPGTRADVRLPDGRSYHATPGTRTYR
ncbi:family 78 glycoside hydrolase catalytic domain [Streptosporangium amethystogenes]|uniref:family 78 glycoside hydrolase catalytic domain n=1 Tax=Streptosporangium amethystogenes TaxID=2002 RepID=UPI0004CA0E20|nr:family 78 glycoside hydrolase catalytic domain [Streptosporangium amethystogenes]